MTVVNGMGEVLVLTVRAYHYQNSVNKLHDSDWLDASIKIQNTNIVLSKNLEFFLVEDLDRIIDWIDGKSELLLFVDTDIIFCKIIIKGITYLKITFERSNRKSVIWEIQLDAITISFIKNELSNIKEKYPCRCHHMHTTEI